MTPKKEWLRAKRARERAARNNRELEQRKVESTAPQTYNASETMIRLNIDNPESVQQLREMAQRGEFPEFIESVTREGRERFYEEFNRLYPDPPGILNDYRVEQVGSRLIQVSFNYDMAEAESPPIVRLPSRSVSESVRQGAIKYAIYQSRPAVENALLTRKGGYSSYDIADRYSKRVLSSAEKAQVDREMFAEVERLMGSPLSREGHEYNELAWLKRDGGWVRAGTLSAEDFGNYPTRGR